MNTVLISGTVEYAEGNTNGHWVARLTSGVCIHAVGMGAFREGEEVTVWGELQTREPHTYVQAKGVVA